MQHIFIIIISITFWQNLIQNFLKDELFFFVLFIPKFLRVYNLNFFFQMFYFYSYKKNKIYNNQHLISMTKKKKKKKID